MFVNVNRTYQKRSVPKFFTKYIHSMDRIFPNMRIVVVVGRFCVAYKIFLIMEESAKWWSE